MISQVHIDGVPDEWLRDFSVDPFAANEMDKEGWYRLTDVVHNHPEAAIRLFEQFSEGRPAGSAGLRNDAVRTFLAVHGDRYENELEALSRRSAVFGRIYEHARRRS